VSIKENYGRYWLAGFIFSIILGAITTVLNFFSTNISSYAMNSLPGLIGGFSLLITGVLIIIILPWIVGRLMAWIYQEFIDKKP